MGVPTVFSGARSYPDLDERKTPVDIGVEQGMKSLVGYLVAAGHSRIGCIPGTSVNSVANEDFRMIGYRNGHGIRRARPLSGDRRGRGPAHRTHLW